LAGLDQRSGPSSRGFLQRDREIANTSSDFARIDGSES
jgi:hypothetical protein